MWSSCKGDKQWVIGTGGKSDGNSDARITEQLILSRYKLIIKNYGSE